MNNPPPPLPAGPFPSTAVAQALNMTQSTIGTWADRGFFSGFDYVEGGRGKVRMMTLRDALATALLWHRTKWGMKFSELDGLAAHRFADMWLRTRGSANPVNALVVRFYGVPGSPDSKVSILPNDDALSGATPSPGASVTTRFDLDAIFLPLVKAIEGSN